ncbi:hypothetical protein MTBUT4_80071 [Magnetospirillum sp. UT-4]|nr:hypothetical protein MTBUT4_80071 [Magnetospirillum sp. UT-4]
MPGPGGTRTREDHHLRRCPQAGRHDGAHGPGDVVVMDNLPAHKLAAVRTAIEATGAELHFLPPYSPDFRWPSRSSRASSRRPRPEPRMTSGQPSAGASIPSPKPNA